MKNIMEYASIKRGLELIAKGKLKPDPSLRCRTCEKTNLDNPIYNRDLGGPYCSQECLERAILEAGFDREIS